MWRDKLRGGFNSSCRTQGVDVRASARRRQATNCRTSPDRTNDMAALASAAASTGDRLFAPIHVGWRQAHENRLGGASDLDPYDLRMRAAGAVR